MMQPERCFALNSDTTHTLLPRTHLVMTKAHATNRIVEHECALQTFAGDEHNTIEDLIRSDKSAPALDKDRI